MAAESFDIELRLINGGLITGAKQSADALKSLENTLEKTSSAFEDAMSGKVKPAFDDTKKSVKSFSDEVAKAMAQAAKLSSDPKGYQLLQKAKKDLADQKKKLLDDAGMGKTPKSPGGGGGGNDGKGFGTGFANQFGFSNLASAEAVGSLIASSIIGAAHMLVSAAEKVASIITGGFEKGFTEGSKFESLKLGYKLSLRGREGADSMEDVGRFSHQTGFDDDAINRMLLPMRRAGFDRQGARSAFAAATDIAAGNGRGGDQGFVQNLLEGFTHIKLKGGVQERRLPEMGVDVKKFYADLAATLKVTTDAAKKMAEEGKVNPQLLLNTIYKGVQERQGGDLGTGGTAYSKTMEARLAKLKDLPNQYFKAVAESPKWDDVSSKFGSLLDNLDPDSPRGQKIVNSVLSAFSELAKVVDKTFTAENIDHFVQGLIQVVKLAGDLVEKLGPFLKKAGDEINDYTTDDKGNKKDVTWLSYVGKNLKDNLFGAGHVNDLNQDIKNGTAVFGKNSIAKSSSGAGALNVQVNVAGGVTPENAKQVGQQVGDEAGRGIQRHMGRVAQEAGAR